MHGISHTDSESRRHTIISAVRNWYQRHQKWCLIIVLPTVLVAAYFYLIAADQYETEAHFVVRTVNSPQSSGGSGGLGQALTMVGASTSNSDGLLVSDYLMSHDAVDALDKRIGLVQRFTRPEADLAARLWPTHPTPERLLSYYLGKVDVQSHSDTGITSLQVRAFRPDDAVTISRALLELGEERVNEMNRRNYESSVAMAKRQLVDAEQNVEDVQRRLTSFRRGQNDVDPKTTGDARVQLVGQLQGTLAEARAQMAAMAATIAPNAPQMVALRAQVAALERQVAAEKSVTSNGPGNVATGLGTYEGLQLRQEFASKRYEEAGAAFEKAREQAAQQQLFLVRVVEPNLPVKSLYPRRARIVFTVFLVLTLAYGIGWLLVAGVREHAA